MRIGYFGDGPWAHNALRHLVSDHEITVAFVCARYDSPDQMLESIANSAGIDFITDTNINSERFLRLVSLFDCDLLVSMSFNQIFKAPIIAMPPLGIINCHAGKLPFYRGRNILTWALINDEPEFGVTVHYVDEGVDTGDIILQRTFPISDLDDYASLLERAYAGCSDLLLQAIKDIQHDRAAQTPQSSIHPTGSYCTARRPGDEILNWHWSSREVFNFVRALCRPGPQARTFLRGAELGINRVSMVSEAPNYRGIPGAVIAKDESSYLVKTGDSFVRVTDLDGMGVGGLQVRVGDRFS